ncbi:MAG: porin [Nitrospirota bacterium]|nr:porin [Nitrospirota bacterium]
MKWRIVPVLAGLALLAAGSVGEANEKLLDILKEKGIITDEQLADLKKDSASDVKVSYKKGFKMETTDKEFSFELGGKVRADFRYFDDNSKNDTFDLRKASLKAKGTLYRYFDYRLGADFASGTAKLKDAYIAYTYFPRAQIKVGQFKVPFGYEKFLSSKYFPFLHKSSITSALTWTRDRGVGVEGTLLNGYLAYNVGVFNGNGSNTSNNNDDFDYAGRLIFVPTRGSDGRLQLAVGVSYSYGQQRGDDDDEIELKTETKSNNTYFVASIPTSRSYDRHRASIGATIIYGRLMLNGEYMKAVYQFDNDAEVTGGSVIAGYLLTDEERTFDDDGQVKYGSVKKPFDPGKRQWGGWELAARYSWFKVDDRFFQSNGLYRGWSAVDRTSNANAGSAFTTGISWRLNDATRILANWVHSHADNDLAGGSSNIFTHDSGNSSDSEDAVLMRLQVAF